MSLTSDDQSLIETLLALTARLRAGYFTKTEKEEIQTILQPYATGDKQAYVNVDMKLVWKYLTYGWVVSSHFDAIENAAELRNNMDIPKNVSPTLALESVLVQEK